MIRIAVIGDHKLAISGIAALLEHQDEFQVSGPLDTRTWHSSLAQADPHLLLVVSNRRGHGPAQVIAQLRDRFPQSKVIFITLVEDEEALLSTLRIGTDGVLDVSADAAFLMRCIRDVLRGEVVMSQSVAARLVGQYNALPSGQSFGGWRREVLTPREVVILRFIADGESNKAIARRLSISEHTVRAHVRNIMRKLEVANRVQAAAVALRSGLTAS